MKSILIGILLTATVAEGDWVSIRVRPPIVFTGHSVEITCMVPKHPDNISLRIGLTDTRESEKQLDGQSATTHRLLINDVPCEAAMAYCVVQRNNGQTQVRQVPIQVIGCE